MLEQNSPSPNDLPITPLNKERDSPLISGETGPVPDPFAHTMMGGDELNSFDQPFEMDMTLGESPQFFGGLEETMMGDEQSAEHAGLSKAIHGMDLAKATRNTILPRSIDCKGMKTLIVDQKKRYEILSSLGEGGVGEVTLVNDHDIHRQVAMKRLKPGIDDQGSLLRFVDEIRTIGQLEHPGIVPIHDVGVSEDGSYYFIMKRIEGETLEEIIAGLDKGDAAYHQRFTPEIRIQIFLDILKAVQFAHAQGIVHRDIKPANIMVGPFGEVVVMDWGLAKRLRNKEEALSEFKALEGVDLQNLADDSLEGPTGMPPERRLYQTQHGALLGTPAYMSPEQAQGLVDQIDERTDTYALTVLFHELMTLRHYLIERKSLNHMLMGVLDESLGLFNFSQHPHQGQIKAELIHYLIQGMNKPLDKRFGSVSDMIMELQLIIAGHGSVHCQITLAKSWLNRGLRSLDQDPKKMLMVSATLMSSLIAMLVLSAYGLFSLVS